MMRLFNFNFSNAELNTTITVDNQDVAVNNYVLALSSSYFERHFFDNRYPAAENTELPPSTTVDDFKRMVATLPPEQRPLDDECFEAILILADRFAMDNLLGLSRDFLLNSSTKPKLFKFRIAHKYGWKETEAQILQSLQLEDFADNFMENAAEFAMLDDDAKAILAARYAQLRPKPMPSAMKRKHSSSSSSSSSPTLLFSGRERAISGRGRATSSRGRATYGRGR